MSNDTPLVTTGSVREMPAYERDRMDATPPDPDQVDEGAGFAAAIATETPVRARRPPEHEPSLMVAPAMAIAPLEPLSYKRPPLDPDLYINRELSWLEFNRRVLDEAVEQANPLLERVKFAAIFCSNLDGWAMIRLAGITRKVRLGITDPGPDGRTPQAQFTAIRRLLQELLDRHAEVIRTQLIPELADAKIKILPYPELSSKDKARLESVFDQQIFPILTPQAIDLGRRFPHVSSGSLNLIVALSTESGPRFARVKIPATISRLVDVPRGDNDAAPPRYRFTWLEQLVAAHLDRLFPGNAVLAAYPFHVLRDADIEPDEDDDDDRHNLMAIMRETLSQRSFGPVIAVMVDTTMPDDVREWLIDQLHATADDLYVLNGPLAADGLFGLTRIDRPDLKDVAFTPKPVRFGSADDGDSPVPPDASAIFRSIRERDILVHHPYQSFNAVVDFIRAAASDPDVVAIKQTLYRLGNDSPLIPPLIEARDDDTQVAVLVELKARFDEENNITWAEELERHGVHVAYGLPGLKTHCKAIQVVRRERDGLRRYVHLGTGNYNATTARIYEDMGLFSAREDFGNDVSELFNALTGFSQQRTYRSIWVAPQQLRQDFLVAIGEEIVAHKRTGKGHLIFKMNQLVDKELIRALYAASRAGVKVDLIVRGICCLRPGVPGWSDNIRVVSLVGRFLEHSRVYAFANGGEDAGRVYLGSADLMERNLDRRVEVVFPVEDPDLRALLRDEILPAYLRDNVNAHALRPDGSWGRIRPAKDHEPFDIHQWLMTRY